MATCPGPCRPARGVCVGSGSKWGCQTARKISRLTTLFRNADRIAFIPDDKEFTIAAVRRLFGRRKGFMIAIRDDGAVEIAKMPKNSGC